MVYVKHMCGVPLSMTGVNWPAVTMATGKDQ